MTAKKFSELFKMYLFGDKPVESRLHPSEKPLYDARFLRKGSIQIQKKNDDLKIQNTDDLPFYMNALQILDKVALKIDEAELDLLLDYTLSTGKLPTVSAIKKALVYTEDERSRDLPEVTDWLINITEGETNKFDDHLLRSFQRAFEDYRIHSRKKTHSLTPAPQKVVTSTSGAKKFKTPLGRNIDKYRKEIGWTIEQLEKASGIDKKSIIGHVKHGRGARPATLKIYSDTFTKQLKRLISVTDLET